MEGQQASAQQAIGLALMQFLQAAQGVQAPQAPRRSVGVWMKKNAQYDLRGHRSHPWTTKGLV